MLADRAHINFNIAPSIGRHDIRPVVLKFIIDLETFFAQAPRINPNVSKITGVICGYRVEEIEDPLMRQIRYMDKLVDELAKGKRMEKILRE